MKKADASRHSRKRGKAAIAVSFAVGLALGFAAAVGAGVLNTPQVEASAPDRSEPMAVSTLPDGSKLCTYVHVDPDTGQHLYVTSAGGIYPRAMSHLNGPTAGANAVTVYDRMEAEDDAG